MKTILTSFLMSLMLVALPSGVPAQDTLSRSGDSTVTQKDTMKLRFLEVIGKGDVLPFNLVYQRARLNTNDKGDITDTVLMLSIQKDFAIRALETLCRIGIGGMFIFASIFKIQDPHQFATLVAQYQFFSALHVDFVNNFFALVYPQFELWFGLAMIVSPFVKESAFAIFWMFVSFIIALAWALWNDLGITCGCFELEGAQDKAEAWTSLIRDIILIWPTFWLATRKNKSLIGIWRR